jgi:sugar (pentulose or hexulose) kinase
MKKTSSRNVKTGTGRKRNGDFHFDARTLVRAARRAVREALRQHKRAGNPVAGVIKGKVVLVPPSRIKI